jgi:hypothetical protein
MDILDAVLSTVSLVFVLIGVIISIWTLKADHERRKKQATLEFYQQISELTEPLRNQIKKLFDNDVLNVSDERYENNEELRTSVRYYLRLMERFSVGVNVGIYDIRVFMRIAGPSTVEYYNQIRPVILEARKEYGNKMLYIEFEHMIENIIAIYKKENKEGDIVYS